MGVFPESVFQNRPFDFSRLQRHTRPMSKLRPIADAVDKIARQSAGKDWGLYASLLSHWTEIVGADYARATTPVKITFPYQPNEPRRKNGVLTVRLPKGLAMEFSFKADLIRQKVNAFFGYDAFARIALDPTGRTTAPAKAPAKLAPETVQAIKNKATAVENADLREALEKFGVALYEKKSSKISAKAP